jgi:hypothetical protein
MVDKLDIESYGPPSRANFLFARQPATTENRVATNLKMDPRCWP